MAKFRKIIALLLVVVMSVSLLGITGVFADDNAADKDSGTVVKNGSVVTSTDGKVTLQKTAVRTGKNTFDITLSVTTKDDVQTSTTGGAAHVVLVIDVSTSMSGNNITNARTAAKGFVDNFFGDKASADNMIAVVTYGKTASTVKSLAGSTEKEAVKTAIGNISVPNNNGTNIQAGIHAAQGILSAGHKDGVKDIIVLLSDGEPTYSYAFTATADYSGCASYHIVTGQRGGSVTNIGAVTPDYDNLIGSGGAYKMDYNTVVIATCSHGEQGFYNYIYSLDGTLKKSSDNGTNNGVATIWEAGAAKAAGTEIYSVMLGSDTRGVMAAVATDAGHAVSTTDATKLGSLFQTIQTSITTATNAGLVSDPMGANINFVGVKDTSDQSASFDETSKTISWNTASGKTTANSDGSKTYTLVYTVTLDTAAQGFVEGQAYATNGTTTFNYDIKGTSYTLNFDVPTVSGIIPTASYSIEFYKLSKTTEVYELQSSDTITENNVKLWTVINAPEGYASKYTNYSFANGENMPLTVSVSGNVMKLYYDPIETAVKVNHFYKSDVTNADGSVTNGEYPSVPQTTSYYPAGEAHLYVGDSFTAPTVPDGYTLDTIKSDAQNIVLVPNGIDGNNNIIYNNIVNLYYTKSVDNSVAHVVVKHVYVTHSWVLVNGKYVAKDIVSDPVTVKNEDVTPATGVAYSSTTAPNGEHSGFAYVSAASTSDSSVSVAGTTATIDLKAGDNDLTLTFEKSESKPANVSFTVNYHYTKSVTAIVDGEISQDGSYVDEKVSTTVDTYAAGETYNISNVFEHNGDTFTADAGNAAKLTGTVTGGNVIDLYYNLTIAPTPSTLTVNHYYRDYKIVTGEDGVSQLTQLDKTSDPVVVTYPASGSTLYAGQNVAVALVSNEGYTFNADDSDISAAGASVAANGQIINVYYDSKPTDARNDASISVIHHYTTHLTTVVGGEIKVLDIIDGSETVYIDGKAGDTITVAEQTEYNGATYTGVSENVAKLGSKTLASGTNSSVDLYYERTASDLKTASLTVNYFYTDYQMTIGADGKAVYLRNEAATKDDINSGAVVGYTAAGQSYTIASRTSFGGEDYTLATGALTGTLSEGENVVNLYYTRETPLDQHTVTVTHSYKTIHIDTVGNKTETTTTSEPISYTCYEGETQTANAALNGFGYKDVTVSGITAYSQDNDHNVTYTVPAADGTINFFYEHVDDQSKPVSYTVNHYYRTINWNEDETKAYGAAETQTYNSYATMIGEGTPNLKPDSNGAATYALDKADATPDFITGTYTITLVDGTNVINFYYTQKIDTRAGTSVTVNHVYRTYDEYTKVTTENTELNVTNTYNTKAEGVWVGNSFTATPIPQADYVVQTADADMTIVLKATADGGNVITIEYLKTVNTTPEIPPYIPPYIPDPDPDPTPTPTPSETPTEPTPTPSETPTEDLGDDDVPLGPAPEEDLGEDQVPMDAAPQTGDSSNVALMWLLLCASFSGLVVLGVTSPKRKHGQHE